MSRIIALLLLSYAIVDAQVSPAISSWLQNTTKTGSYYTNGSSTTVSNGILVNCQKVEYSSNWVYVTTHGIPAYPTGPFLDGNPSIASDQNAIFRLSLKPVKNTGTLSATTGGNIGIFINGVAVFDFRDGVGWNTQANALCGGPGNPPCPGGMGVLTSWNRDAVVAERKGFDCAKGHPAMGNYHHHQNPSAFKLDLNNVSNVCSLYDADGLYVLDSSKHSPLIGYAYDGFPIYGAYAYKNTDGTGGIIRMKSGYHLRKISDRTKWADGTDVPDGPPVNQTYPLGYFREDYEYITSTSADVLDEHNGRWCVTPEYPAGTYCYFATVDEKWNSAYPYLIGPTFYGVKNGSKVTGINEQTTVYKVVTENVNTTNTLQLNVFPVTRSELIVVQSESYSTEDIPVNLINEQGHVLQHTEIKAGSTIAYFDTQTLYDGLYFVQAGKNKNPATFKVMIIRD
ncbi:MAG: YHYH protein [Saprospiraceae bacterium]|nr:YHYH protein [Saprospiraceae bacterium]HMW39740.1 YHYH protein [Saprospiraceae bacterium]HMX89049.1 YHYH protein [Saprospiraceae bacterium]HMZ40678.1 YHYH protein [Saprospiraceae bacterium]HNA63939.1 YHYH protein [Saprospiraceae bacterium]